MRAYVLIDAPLKASAKIAAELQQKPGVILADVVNGPHSVIACVEAEDPSSIAKTILFDIRNLKDVKDLTVYLGMEGETGQGTQDTIQESLLPGFSETVTSDMKTRRGRRGRKAVD